MSQAVEHGGQAEHGQGAHTGTPHHQPEIGDVFLPAANFAVFLLLLIYFLRGPVREFFRARTERLRDALEAGAHARRDAEALRAELERDVRDLPALRERLRADLRATAERQRDTLLESGRQAAARLRQDAHLVADHEVAAARQALRAEVIEEAVRQATLLVRDAVRPEDQERFVREFMAGAGAAS
jgi:F-type H+-transporting ATPase subunit b